ncbi:vacuolar amino acid permease [Amanita rubescens]|nr:vacuolar amino acid permease [Amanita rubescens]
MSAVDHATERDSLLPSSGTNAARSPGPLEISRTTRFGILAGIWLGSFLSKQLVPTMLTSISSEFEKSHQASWLGTSYLLATCTFTPLYGRLCDVMGRKGANHTALFFAGSGILLCGFSRNLEMLILSRFLCGIGGGGLMTTSSIVVSDMYSLRSRGLAQGVASVFNGLGLGFGGPFGGLITDWLGWRWAFLIQMPLFLLSFILTTYNLNYVTAGKGKNTTEVIKRIDYGGSVTLLLAVGAALVFLSARYNEALPWSDTVVVTSFTMAWVFFALPVLAPSLLRQKVPVLVGLSNFLVSTCNFAVTYFFPMWFQTVMLTRASIAGLHLLPNSISMSIGSLFAGWMIHYTGNYKIINMIFGVFPFIGATLITQISESSGLIQSWFSIIPLGFGNAVVMQTTLIALLAHLPETHIATGTGFGQLFRGLGQVGGVAFASAIFQFKLDAELHARINVVDLPQPLQRQARDAYAASLKLVFAFAALSTFLAYVVRIPVRFR